MGLRAESVRVAHPLFQEGGGGSSPTSALSLTVESISVERACELNRLWHSRLPVIEESNVFRNAMQCCFSATYGDLIYATAIWTSPVARMLNDGKTLELRRYAIADDAPKNTGSRVLAIMAKLIKSRFGSVCRLVSYQDTAAHAGTIYAAAGWAPAAKTSGRQWTCPSRHRRAVQSAANKVRWEKLIR